MLRIVVDTSSLVSYILTQGKLMSRVIEHWRSGSLILLSSPATRAELAAVLSRPQIRRLSTVPLDQFVQGLERFSENVPGIADVTSVCRDPQDTKFLVCAQEGQAHYLVSSDRDLLDLRRHGETAIVNPGEFLLGFELHALLPREIAIRFRREILAEIQTSIPLDRETEKRLAEALELTRSP